MVLAIFVDQRRMIDLLLLAPVFILIRIFDSWQSLI